MGILRRLMATLAIVGLTVAGSGGVSAQNDAASTPPDDAVRTGTGTLTVHWRDCESIPLDGDWFGSCHETPQRDHTIWIVDAGGQRFSQPADRSGNAVFTVEPGTYQVEEVPGDFVDDSMLFCSTLENPGTRVDSPIAIGAGENYLCDYYVVGSDARGDVTPSPSPAAGQIPTYTAAIYFGNCVPGPFVDPVMVLNDAAMPDGDVVGSTGGIPPYVSFTHGFQDFDTLLARQSVVAVFDSANPETLVTCGFIGGIYGQDGALAITLFPVQDSGVSGVAYLRSGTNDSLSVTLFLLDIAART